jgi:hypothetical protein
MFLQQSTHNWKLKNQVKNQGDRTKTGLWLCACCRLTTRRDGREAGASLASDREMVARDNERTGALTGGQKNHTRKEFPAALDAHHEPNAGARNKAVHQSLTHVENHEHKTCQGACSRTHENGESKTRRHALAHLVREQKQGSGKKIMPKSHHRAGRPVNHRKH